MANQKAENRKQKAAGREHITLPPPQSGEGASGEAVAGEGLVTRAGVAAALKVSVRTVDRMLAAGEIKPVRMRGWSVRFSLAEVIRKLAATAATRKHGPGKETA
jgi:excisionase family DNA binding protein